MDQRLRDRALAALARNARGFSPLDAMGKALTIGKITYDMHRDPAYQGQNNPRDAARHAEWSRRMARVDPLMAEGMGDLVELVGAARTYLPNDNPDRKPLDERRRAMDAMRDMDQHNNAVGRQAAAEGRSVDPRDLQMGPWDRPPAGR